MRPCRIEAVADLVLATKVRDPDALLCVVIERIPDVTLADFERGLALAARRLNARIQEEERQVGLMKQFGLSE